MSADTAAGLVVFGSWFDNHTDTVPKPFELPWTEFCEELQARFETREDKFSHRAPGFSLARFVDKDDSPANRDKKHVDVLSGVVLDFDENFDPEIVFERVEGLVWLAYTTFSHAPTEGKLKWRLVVPFSSPIPGPAYKAVRAWLLARLNNNATKQEADKAASSTANFYYGPGCPVDQIDHAEWRASDGAVLELPPLSSFKRGLPETRILGTKIDWDYLKAKMKSYPNPQIKAAFRQVLKGKPFAEKGGRDDTLLRMCGALAGWALQCEPEALASIFGSSLAAMEALDPDDPPPTVEGAADKIARSQTSLSDRSRDEVEMAVEDAQVVDLPEQAEGELADQWAAEVGFANADELRRHLLIRTNTSIYLWRCDLATWVGPLTEAATAVSAAHELPLFPGVSVWMRKVDGGMRKKTLAELLDEYGRVADAVVLDLKLARAVYDPEHRVLTLPGAPRRKLEPLEDPFVAEWLCAFGGEKSEKLLDWIAGLTDHNNANSILFIKGSPGIGKGLLVRGLSRVWDTDGATDMKRIAGAFDADLLRCPLVKIDEGRWNRFVDVTTLLRELATEKTRNVNRKHLDSVELRGYVRVIITANNFNLFANDEHPLVPDDRDALAQRFFEVEPDGPRAEALLLSLHPDERDALATEDRIARHALWLAETRKPERTGRFIVAGEHGGRFAFKIITEDRKWGSWTIEWLSRWLSDPVQIDKECGPTLLWRGEGRAIVSPQAVINTFERVLKNKRAPQSSEISDALRSLSKGGGLIPFPNERGMGFEVVVPEVAAWSKEKGVGHPDSIIASARGETIARSGVIVKQSGNVLPMNKGTK